MSRLDATTSSTLSAYLWALQQWIAPWGTSHIETGNEQGVFHYTEPFEQIRGVCSSFDKTQDNSQIEDLAPSAGLEPATH